MENVFQDRTEAGLKLAQAIQETAESALVDPVVIALPRGGLPVALPVAKRLRAPLELLVVRKIGAPLNPEYALGAATEDDYFWVDPEVLRALSVSDVELEELVRECFSEVHRRVKLYRGGAPLPDLRGRSVVIVDDGFATGSTAAVAARFLRTKNAREIILAAPVGSREAVSFLGKHADRVICLEVPDEFYSVGQWYRDFNQVEDDEVIEVLKAAKKPFEGELRIPANAKGIVIFAHGSGSSRFSPRNRRVASMLFQAGFGTLLFDLLSEEEANDRERVFDIPFLADRLIAATEWVRSELKEPLPIGYFGASTGAGAALWAASELAGEGGQISAIVSRGGRPDLAMSRLERVDSPTLLIVGGDDVPVIAMNEEALEKLPNAKLEIVPGATHLFEEPGTLDEVARLAIGWFKRSFSKSEKQSA